MSFQLLTHLLRMKLLRGLTQTLMDSARAMMAKVSLPE